MLRLLAYALSKAFAPSAEEIGASGERSTYRNLWWSLDAATYRRFRDVILPASNGTSQLDHLLISRFGLFIIETKNYKGWIFGSENQEKWTQTLGRQKHSFQNPLRQVFRQKKVLAEFLGIDESRIHVVIHFPGDCTFKTPMPSNVINSGLGRYIKSFTSVVLTDAEVGQIISRVHTHLSQSPLTAADHVRSLRERHSATTICPKCGAALTERTARRGSNAGAKFIGCTRYPTCRFTRSL